MAACFLIGNADYLANFIDTLKTGALVPLVLSIILMLGRHFVQAASYDAAFDAVGHATGFWHNVILIFSLVFINTFCLFSGATGVAFIARGAMRGSPREVPFSPRSDTSPPSSSFPPSGFSRCSWPVR